MIDYDFSPQTLCGVDGEKSDARSNPVVEYEKFIRCHTVLLHLLVLYKYILPAGYHAVHNLLSSSLLSKNLKIKIYRTTIFSVVLYGCETWSLTLREESKFRVSENRVLRRIFGPKRDEVAGEWRKLHNDELNDLYPSPNIIL